jgi:hypothetical protein
MEHNMIYIYKDAEIIFFINYNKNDVIKQKQW